MTMEHFESLYWKRAGSNLSLGIDFKSIERKGRTVVGFATLDNVDFAGDIVPLEASIEAFKNFRGNIRAQHDKSQPVGRLEGFEVADYYDEKTGETYKGIKVAVYISEGAEHIWKMVEDGTLSAFSIGAAVKKASKVYSEKLQRSIQVIDEYVLLELSLVDSPMNGLANVISVHKAFDSLDESEVEKGFVSNNLLWCASDRVASKSTSTTGPCPVCGEAMANLGHVEENADIQKQLNKVFEISEKGGHPQVAETVNKDAEGTEAVSEVAETTNEVVEGAEGTAEEAATEEVVVSEETVAEVDTENEDASNTVETAADTSEAVEVTSSLDEAKIEELLSNLREVILNDLALAKKGNDELVERFEQVVKGFEELSANFASLKTAQEEVTTKVASFESKMSETTKRLDVVADSTAVKKSLDSVHESETVVKSTDEALFDGFFSSNIDGWDN